MVQSVFEEVALGSDEHVPEESAEVLPELSNVEHLHFEGHVGYSRKVVA